MSVPSYREELISQIPALQTLMAMGWRYLTPAEALTLRGGKRSAVILTDVLTDWLREHNAITYKGQRHAFSEANLREAVRQLTDVPLADGLVRTNERVYELLTLGISLPQDIASDRRSYSLHYIDWANPHNNVFHVTDEFTVERRLSHENRRPDVVLFVNGIPLAVIECKRPDKVREKGIEQGIIQLGTYQQDDEIPHLFMYAQILMAISTNFALYATVKTPKAFWSVWQEEDAAAHEELVSALINTPISDADAARLYDHRDNAYYIRQDFADRGDRLPTVQDRAVVSLLHPEHLLELTYQYIVFDNGVKKIARYQQYFAIKATMNRVAHLNHQGERTGGVIWHTTGSGKSLTMVMLAKALALHPSIPNPCIVIVTDRVDLDDQIWETFKACGKSVAKADSGGHLIDLIRSNKVDVITTVINKFETVTREKVADDNVNIFVLVDEGHRSQYGTIHAKMRQVFKHACYIGFTGTPLTRTEKSTARKFGDFIHKYTMRQAVEDGAVVPLLYEGRMVALDVNRAAIDTWFERVTRKLTDEQRADLKRKFSRNEEISRADLRLKEIAYDLSAHYQSTYKDTGFKAMLATPSKEVAVKYLNFILEFGMVDAALIISPPDTREGIEEGTGDETPAVLAYWKRMMQRYGSEENMLREILADFGKPDGVDLLIVVDKLLVGFDEPRCRVLYVDKPLREHGLLQAIARVNRVFEGKDAGLIIDYRGVLGQLSEAIDTYNALEAYDGDDLDGLVTDVAAEIDRLPQLHSNLWDLFKTVNHRDAEALERFLEPEDRRQHFYEALTAYARAFKVALSAVAFYEEVPEKQIAAYKRDLHFFHNLRVSVKERYSEVIDYRDYELKVRKLIDEHIKADGTKPITPLIDIFDQERFDQEVERVIGAAAKADTIAYRLKRTVTEKMEQDPAFYRRFSELIDATIAAYRDGRISELEYLERATDALEQVRAGHDRSQPAALSAYRDAPAYYGVIRELLVPRLTEDSLAEMAIQIEALIEREKIRDWARNPEVQNRIKGKIDDYLYAVREAYQLALSIDEQDMIIDNVIEIARKRDGRH